MPVKLQLATTAADRVAVDLLAVPVYADRKLGPGADIVDKAIGRTLRVFMTETGFEGKRGETLAVPTNGKLGAKAVILVGVGERAKLDADALRRAGAALAKRASKVKSVATTLLDAVPDSLDKTEAAQALAEGIRLGSYQFLKYKKDPKPTQLQKVVVLGRGGARIKAAVDRANAVADAVTWARDLVNEPAEAKGPADIVTKARALARTTGLKVTVLTPDQMKAQRMGGVLGVGMGSDRPPRFLRLEYSPRGAKQTIAFVGKGVVFDSGGLSLKTAAGMETMKTDMAGGAAVIAAMSALAKADVKVRVRGYVPLVENMPSGSAVRPGDVLKIRNGKTVEVLNTDAEGRLILADALSLATDDKPDAIIDLATLTGACVVALGDKIAGLMGNNDAWVEQVKDAAARAGESVWHLPLPEEYRRLIDAEVADIRNTGSSPGGGTLTAGLFLREFVEDVPWVHLDIAGPARAGGEDGYVTKGGTGFGVRTLIELARTFKTPR